MGEWFTLVEGRDHVSFVAGSSQYSRAGPSTCCLHRKRRSLRLRRGFAATLSPKRAVVYERFVTKVPAVREGDEPSRVVRVS